MKRNTSTEQEDDIFVVLSHVEKNILKGLLFLTRAAYLESKHAKELIRDIKKMREEIKAQRKKT